MPKGLSISIPGPAVPATSAAVAPATVPVAPALVLSDSGPADFLAQLKAALKSLTKAVTQPQAVVDPAAPPVPTPVTGGEPAPAAAEVKDNKESKPVEPAMAPLPEVLAVLGIVAVPIVFQASPPPRDTPTGPGAAPVSAALTQLSQALSSASASGSAPGPLDLTKLPAAANQMPSAAGPAPLPAVQAIAVPPLSGTESPQAIDGLTPTLHATTAAPLVAPTLSTPASAPATAPTPTDPSAAVLTPAALTIVPQGPSAQPHAPTVALATDGAGQLVGTRPHLPQGAFQQGSRDERPQSDARSSAPIDTPATPVVTTANDSAVAATAAGATVQNTASVLPPNANPAAVVSQIAHQADLYRLPGNRGVRIQLHPEGLGGVEVSMRYGVGGALQLHIAVEHAATGTLVQAGWTELRDALATQGISPDRLIMSVTAPSGNSQLDFAGGGGNRQAEPGLAGFAQDRSGSQRQDNPDQNGPRGWNGAIEPTSSSDDNPRVASTAAVTSHIDYRA